MRSSAGKVEHRVSVKAQTWEQLRVDGRVMIAEILHAIVRLAGVLIR